MVSAGTSRLLVDIGWPGTLGTMKANLARMGTPLREIRHAFATHYHPDHAGLAEEPDPLGLLVGDGRFMRHVKLKPNALVDESALQALIDAAHSDVRARLKQS